MVQTVYTVSATTDGDDETLGYTFKTVSDVVQNGGGSLILIQLLARLPLLAHCRTRLLRLYADCHGHRCKWKYSGSDSYG